MDGTYTNADAPDGAVLSVSADEATFIDHRSAERLMAELIKMRKRRRIRQDDIAQALGITQGRISQVEKQPGEVRLALILGYARAINVELLWIKSSETPSAVDGKAAAGFLRRSKQSR